MTPYSYLRALLDDARNLLGGVFEQGLSNCGRLEQDCGALALRLKEAGLEHGARLFDGLAAQFADSRFHRDWESGDAVVLFSQSWRYLAACLDRLDFLEARAGMEADSD